MDTYWPETLQFDHRKKAIETQLIRGRDITNQLQILLTNNKPPIQDALMSADDLVTKILGSFTQTLSILNSGESDEVSQIPAIAVKSEDSGESCKSTSTLKDRRGCYKRRRTSQSWSRVTPILVDDGHSWRKYGQKVILNANHPRNYYRCTHKHDQGCLATKQVQKTEDDPPKYRITYSCHHTCKNLLKAPQIILDHNPGDSSILINFQKNITQETQDNNDPIFPQFSLVKQECREETLSDDLDHDMTHNPPSSSSDYLLSPDLATFDSSGPMSVLSSTLGSDHGDVISGINSCSASTHSLDMGHFDFEDVLQHFDF